MLDTGIAFQVFGYGVKRNIHSNRKQDQNKRILSQKTQKPGVAVIFRLVFGKWRIIIPVGALARLKFLCSPLVSPEKFRNSTSITSRLLSARPVPLHRSPKYPTTNDISYLYKEQPQKNFTLSKRRWEQTWRTKNITPTSTETPSKRCFKRPGWLLLRAATARCYTNFENVYNTMKYLVWSAFGEGIVSKSCGKCT